MYDLKNLNFRKLLTQYRKSRGYSLETIGNIIGKTKSTISKYEKGDIIPDIITILEICNALNINLSQLFPIFNPVKVSSLFNPFKTNKLYMYYLTDNNIITSIIEVFETTNHLYVQLYNGVKDISLYATEYLYSYEGILECNNTIGYIHLYNTKSNNTQLEKIQISFNIPWSKSFDITSFFILALTPNSLPIVKKGIISVKPIENFEPYKNDLQITKYNLNKLQNENAWILENLHYNHFFYNS